MAAPHTALGCDLEEIEPRSAGFVADYFTQREAAAVAAVPATARDIAVNLLWSAKEAVLKARRTGLRSDTRSVELEVDLAGTREPATGDVRGATTIGAVIAWAPFSAVDELGTAWRGWWSRPR